MEIHEHPPIAWDFHKKSGFGFSLRRKKTDIMQEQDPIVPANCRSQLLNIPGTFNVGLSEHKIEDSKLCSPSLPKKTLAHRLSHNILPMLNNHHKTESKETLQSEKQSGFEIKCVRGLNPGTTCSGGFYLDIQDDAATTSPILARKKSYHKIHKHIIPSLTSHRKQPEVVGQFPSRPSQLEIEFASQDNQSFNDPDFVRRASQRWKQNAALHDTGMTHFLTSHQQQQGSSHQWPTSRPQARLRKTSAPQTLQPLYQEIMFAVPQLPKNSSVSNFLSHGNGCHDNLLDPPVQRTRANTIHGRPRCDKKLPQPQQRASGNSLQSSRESSNSELNVLESGFRRVASLRMFHHKNKSAGAPSTKEDPVSSKRTTGLPSRSSSSSLRASNRKSALVKLAHDNNLHGFLALDDAVVSQVRRESLRETFKSQEILKTKEQSSFSRLGQLGKSFSRPKKDKLEVNTGSIPASRSYQSALSSLDSSGSIASSSSFTSHLPEGAIGFQDIFVTEPQISEKFAIMFPTEPRPEWHRHLRKVIRKASSKILRKPDQDNHDQCVPEDLKYQLKQIYVY